MKNVLRLAGIDNYQEDWEELYTSGRRVIIKYRSIHQLQFSPNVKGNFYLQEIPYLRLGKGELPYIGRGRWVAWKASEANRLLKREVFNDF